MQKIGKFTQIINVMPNCREKNYGFILGKELAFILQYAIYEFQLITKKLPEDKFKYLSQEFKENNYN